MNDIIISYKLALNDCVFMDDCMLICVKIVLCVCFNNDYFIKKIQFREGILIFFKSINVFEASK